MKSGTGIGARIWRISMRGAIYTPKDTDGHYHWITDAEVVLLKDYEALQQEYFELLNRQDATIPQKEQAAEWIPVSERLPDRENDIVLVYAHDYLPGADTYWLCSQKDKTMWGYATHWMPLPEPPK